MSRRAWLLREESVTRVLPYRMERSGRNVALPKHIWPIGAAAFRLRCMLIVVLSGAIIAATPLPMKRDFEGPARYSPREIQRAIAVYAKRYRLDPDLLRAVIKRIRLSPACRVAQRGRRLDATDAGYGGHLAGG